MAAFNVGRPDKRRQMFAAVVEVVLDRDLLLFLLDLLALFLQAASPLVSRSLLSVGNAALVSCSDPIVVAGVRLAPQSVDFSLSSWRSLQRQSLLLPC